MLQTQLWDLSWAHVLSPSWVMEDWQEPRGEGQRGRSPLQPDPGEGRLLVFPGHCGPG